MNSIEQQKDNEDELKEYVESLWKEVERFKNRIFVEVSNNAAAVYKSRPEIIEAEYRKDFLCRLFYHPNYIYHHLAVEAINNKMSEQNHGLDSETRSIEFSVMRLYYLKMLEMGREPFPSDYVLFLMRFTSALAMHIEISIQLRRIVPEEKWIPFYEFLSSKQEAILQSNYTSENCFRYIVDHVTSLILRHEMGYFSPVR
jgi:hypothetical protein